MLHTTDIEGVSALKNGSNGDVAESNSQRGCNSNTNEDDWVDVKALDGPAVHHKNSSSTSKFGADLVRILSRYVTLEIFIAILFVVWDFTFHFIMKSASY